MDLEKEIGFYKRLSEEAKEVEEKAKQRYDYDHPFALGVILGVSVAAGLVVGLSKNSLHEGWNMATGCALAGFATLVLYDGIRGGVNYLRNRNKNP